MPSSDDEKASPAAKVLFGLILVTAAVLVALVVYLAINTTPSAEGALGPMRGSSKESSPPIGDVLPRH